MRSSSRTPGREGIFLFRPHALVCSLLLLVYLSFPSETLCLDPHKEIAQYHHQVWLKKDGLPQNSVLTLAQTPDGYLWVGTYEGLARFDGIRFNVFTPLNTPELKGKLISTLHVTRDGTLWIGMMGGGGLTQFREGKFKTICLTTNDEQAGVGTLYEDRKGLLWVGTNLGLFSLRGDSIEKAYTSSDGLAHNYVSGITEDEGGRLLVAAGGRISVLQNDCFVDYRLSSPFSGKVRTLRSQRDGKLWIGTYDSGVYCASSAGLQRFSMRNGLSSDIVLTLLQDTQGALWVGTKNGGLSRIHGGKVSVYNSSSGLSGDDVYSVLEDREGNIWAGVATGGLNRFVESKFTTFATDGTATRNFIYSVFEDRKGPLLIGTASREVMQLARGRFIPYSSAKGPLAGVPVAFHRDRHGVLWIGTTSGLYRVAGGRLDHHPLGFVSAIKEDSLGRIWVGHDRGLLVFARGRWGKFPTLFNGRPVDVRAIEVDRHGTLWIGTMNLGLFRFSMPADVLDPKKGTLTELSRYLDEGGVRLSWITSLYEDSMGTMWITSERGGLSRVKEGKFFNFAAGGLPEDGIHFLLDDGKGSFWLSSNNGIFRLAKTDLDAFAAGSSSSYPWTQFGLSDGMASDECNGGFQSAGVRTHDGKLWFPTTAGVVAVNPDSLPTNAVAPTVLMEHVRVDRQDVSSTVPLRASHGDGDFEFAYTGISLGAPEGIRFRVTLEGFDKGWVDVGSRRISSYTNLPPGEYTFRVQARNADGVWNRTGASFAFTVEPRVYQTWWFACLVVLSVMMAGAGLHAVYRRDRDRQLVAAQLESKLAQAQLKVLETQVQPHFLFNTLNGITVLIRDDPEKATRMISRLSEFVRMALDRSGIQEIPLREELFFVDRYLQIELLRFADRLTVQQQIEEALLDALVPTMILQPLIENAIRHGVSKRRGRVTIQLEARRINGTLTLHVRDNGAGLPPVGDEGLHEGIGLTNTRARLRQLYGEFHRFELLSPASGGVDVEMSIPFHKEPLHSWKESAR